MELFTIKYKINSKKQMTNLKIKSKKTKKEEGHLCS